ncbi:MAG: aldehyde dehydrogenase family protein, partial [bacterium]|nr:aldehyde dehydrogenase family protein [bacterium]
MASKNKVNKNLRWPELSPLRRAAIINKLSRLLIKHQAELARTMAQEIGKPVKAGRHEVMIASERVKAFCAQIPGFIADEKVHDDAHEESLVRFEPVGTVAVISPWNAPIFVSLANIIPPLLCGNRVIWKPSEYATKTGKALAKIFKELERFGLPKGVFVVRYGGKEVGQKLVESDINA